MLKYSAGLFYNHCDSQIMIITFTHFKARLTYNEDLNMFADQNASLTESKEVRASGASRT